MRRRTLAAALGLALAATLPSWPAAADPNDDVAAAQAAVDADAAEVARLELELAAQQASLDSAWTAVGVAGEAYTQATADAEAAAAAGRIAAARASAAQDDAEVARDELARIALEAYRSGGSMDTIGAFVQADGLEDLLARQDAVERLGKRAQGAVQRLEAAQLVAQTMQDRAGEAERAARDTAARAQSALTAAQDAQASAEQMVAQAQADRDAMVAELARARHVAVAVEAARQDQLDADRRARAEAAARAERTGHGTPSTPTPSTPTPSTPTPSTPTPPPSTPTPPPSTPTPPPSTPTPPPSTPTPPPSTPTPPPSTPTPPPSTPTPPPAPPGLGTGTSRGSESSAAAAVTWALAQVGKPYVYGAAGPDTFDCSGLTMRAWQSAGVSLNRTSRDQYRQVLKISYDQLRPGDLVFYGSNPNDWSTVYHVAMYIGNGQVVEAPRPGLTVRTTAMRWSSTMAFAGRP